jgi:hypothetical protein
MAARFMAEPESAPMAQAADPVLRYELHAPMELPVLAG